MRLSLLASIFVALALSPLVAKAQEEASEKDAFVFLSDEENSSAYKFEEYVRLSFADDSFILTPSNPSQDSIVIPYSNFNKVQFGNYGCWTDIKNLPMVVENSLYYDRVSNTVIVRSNSSESILIAIFSIDGMLLAQGYREVNVSMLPTGGYVAIATNGKTKDILKFHK